MCSVLDGEPCKVMLMLFNSGGLELHDLDGQSLHCEVVRRSERSWAALRYQLLLHYHLKITFCDVAKVATNFERYSEPLDGR